jgi:hypothetical protein
VDGVEEIENREIFTVMGIDKSVPTSRPDIEDLYLVFWATADIKIPWPRDLSPKEAIIEWAMKEIKNES